MTQEEFDSTEFRKGMRVHHPIDGEGTITGVDFAENLIEVAFDGYVGENWCRYENITIINKP